MGVTVQLFVPGRSSGSYTFSINMTRINNIDVNSNDKTMMVGPGTTWIEVYKKVCIVFKNQIIIYELTNIEKMLRIGNQQIVS